MLSTAVVVRGAAVVGTAYGVRGGAGTEGLGTVVVAGVEVAGAGWGCSSCGSRLHAKTTGDSGEH